MGQPLAEISAQISAEKAPENGSTADSLFAAKALSALAFSKSEAPHLFQSAIYKSRPDSGDSMPMFNTEDLYRTSANKSRSRHSTDDAVAMGPHHPAISPRMEAPQKTFPQFDINKLKTSDPTVGTDERHQLIVEDARSHEKTLWNWNHRGVWSRTDALGNRIDMLPADKSTVTRDAAGHLVGFTGDGAIQKEIRDLVNMEDPIKRNYWITQTYSDMSKLFQRMFPEGSGINWMTLGTWASRTVGKQMRGELSGPVQFLEHLNNVNHNWNPFASWMGSPLSTEQQEKTSRLALGHGNELIMREIGAANARFISTFQGETAPNPQKLKNFLATFKPEQATLARAFESYYKAMYTQDRTERLALMHDGNVRTAWHEQNQVQSAVERAFPSSMRGAVTWLSTMALPDREVNLAPAGDWTDLNRRMVVITDLLKSEQTNTHLFQEPFSADRLAYMNTSRFDK